MCRLGHWLAAQYLAEVGRANVEAITTNCHSEGELFTALHVASERGQLDIVRFLVRDGGGGANAQALTITSESSPTSRTAFA
jgi:Ankyrin repeat